MTTSLQGRDHIPERKDDGHIDASALCKKCYLSLHDDIVTGILQLLL